MSATPLQIGVSDGVMRMRFWPGDPRVFAVAEPFIKQCEVLDLSPYLDMAGIPTIGWGTSRYPSGRSVTMGDPRISPDYAQDCFLFSLQNASAAIAPAFTRMPSAHQAAAALSLSYNIGYPSFLSSTILRQFNAGNIAAAADGFLLWDKAHVDGQLVVVPGLRNRRAAERALFLTAD